VLPAPDAQVVSALSAALQIGTAAAKVLVHRGFSETITAGRFLHPAFEELHDPMTLRDMPAAVERIARAIRERERILIYGDYDGTAMTSVKRFQLAGGIAIIRSTASRTATACVRK
jgi:single-stranded-DNA-specific exonuclease